jgi:hypothetical protein
MAVNLETRKDAVAIERALQAEGWTVRCRQMWVAEARKGHECEQAVGETKEAALDALHELAKIDDAAGVP